MKLCDNIGIPHIAYPNPLDFARSQFWFETQAYRELLATCRATRREIKNNEFNNFCMMMMIRKNMQ
jgi:hypothetical protein